MKLPNGSQGDLKQLPCASPILRYYFSSKTFSVLMYSRKAEHVKIKEVKYVPNYLFLHVEK